MYRRICCYISHETVFGLLPITLNVIPLLRHYCISILSSIVRFLLFFSLFALSWEPPFSNPMLPQILLFVAATSLPTKLQCCSCFKYLLKSYTCSFLKLGIDFCLLSLYNGVRNMNRGCGGIGRRVRLRGVWETVWVQVPSTAPKIRVFQPGFFFTQNAQKAFIHIAFLKVHAATWIRLKSPEITMGCTRVARRLHADLRPVFLNKRGFGKPRLHAFWRISHTANLFCLPGQERFFCCIIR